ncbi:hypothetical protein BM221_010520 [Beauveria bassiana]|uniref:Uncharacterized protein n=1 Tax=Beauveria bassiana TaxID=176275 RepID=A0A2N6N8P5_BEABA|nr:hypothetical protein BM221_010520 [Beauveria bassiana]
MLKGDLEGLAVLGMDHHGDGLADSKLGSKDINLRYMRCVNGPNLVIRLNLVIVSGVGEGEGKHALLLQVGLVDTGKASSDDGQATEVAGLKGSMLTRTTLAIVPITNNDPLDALLLVIAGDGGHGIPITCSEIFDLVGLTVGLIDGTNQHVVGDVVKMATVLQPGTSHGDVIGSGLSLGLDKNGYILGILAIPRLERLENLETIRGRGDLDVDSRAVLGRGLLVGQRVEVERASDSESNDEVRRCDEGVSCGISVISTSKVTVVRRQDGIGFTFLDVGTIPLTNARTASVSKNNATELLKCLKLTVAGDGGTNLFRSRGDGESSLGLDSVVKSITSDRRSAGHVFVGRVGARANQTDPELLRPAILLDSLAEF